MQALTDAIAEQRVLDAIAVQLQCPWRMTWPNSTVWRCFMYGLRLVCRRTPRFNYAIYWDAITAALRKANTAVTETWLPHRHAMGLTDPQLYHICGFTGLTAAEVREHWAPCVRAFDEYCNVPPIVILLSACAGSSSERAKS
jgi:hypothetical protein